MDNNNPFPKRKPTRWASFDYNSKAAYFITICTDKRKNILSHVAPYKTTFESISICFNL